MRRLLLFCIFLVNTFCVWSVDLHRKIDWYPAVSDQKSDERTAAGLFKGAVLENENALPMWVESFELESSNAQLSISDTVFEPFNNNSFVLPDSIGSELKYSTLIGTSAGKSHLRVSIFPFVKRNNQVLKLTEFTISINENPNTLKSGMASFAWKSSSVLNSGKWIKIKATSKGIYKITYDQIKAWGFANPEEVCLYGNGGAMLPVLNKDLQTDDLLAYPVWKGKDNANKDCLFFYSSGNIQLKYDIESGTLSHQQNYYSTETYFYLSDQSPPLLINKAAELAGTAGRQVTSYPNYTYYEKELTNLIASGSHWYGEHFSMGGTQIINISLDNPDVSQTALMKVSAAARSSASSSMDVIGNGKVLLNMPFGVYSDYIFARNVEKGTSLTLSGKTLQLRLTYNASNSVSEAWLDYVGINYQSALSMSSDAVNFRGRGVNGAIQLSEFVLSGATSETKILNVTDPQHVIEMPVSIADGQLKFKSNSAFMNEYVAFNPGGNFPVPEKVAEIPNQNLHGEELTQMIIISNSKLLTEANELAEFHRTTDQMSVQVITPDLIYNEFSGGMPDPGGIRNFLRMCFDRGRQSSKNTLKYVLLMGDGSFDNRNIQGKNLNLLPTYQSEESLSLTDSYVTDDFFVMLDESEGGVGGIIDLGIGRIPANTEEEAKAVVKKIKTYRQQEALGNWRNTVTFIADDRDGNTHMQQAEDLAVYVNKTYPAFFTDKIYFDSYKKILSAGGEKYPDVTEAIINRVKRGTLIMNYTGHANERNLADESVLDIGIIDSWTNYNRLPLFVTATCEYSRFDANETSAGEHILFNPLGGGIGLFSTTRLVYSGANSTLNGKFFEYVFEKDPQGNNLRLGDVMRLAKAAAFTGKNQLNFTLLADPALRLANPEMKVMTTSIDDKSTELQADTIRTLSVVKVKGYVADSNGEKLSTFNGEIIPTVYDKAMEVRTLGNSNQMPMDYTVQNNVIYSGLASVKDGEFEFSFFVPKDISYKLDKGKIIYYAYNETQDAQGYFDDFYIGGTSNNVISDSQGPSIDLLMNSNSFKDGGTVSANAVLIANITDETGINTAGIGIGHDITGVLDGDNSKVLVLNDYFQAAKDTHTEGSVIFPLADLAEGNHTLLVKVWDVLNNSSEKEIHFVVKDDFRIESVACYPNPMQDKTSFVFTHNQPDQTFEVTLEIFQPSGARVDMLTTNVGSHGTESLPLEWNPAERSVQMKAGVYIYRMTVTADGKTGSGSGRLVFVYR
ncbi:MAG TPA: type IX secretion system sortase PorU [Prolixibacteraceae bacterium]|jgi:hypothetical protein